MKTKEKDSLKINTGEGQPQSKGGNNIIFGDTNLIFNLVGESKTREQLAKEFPFEFLGKNDFIEFYQTHNGVYFPEGAEVIYEVNDDDYGLEIEFIYTVEHLKKMWEATKEHSPEANCFAETHIPFARDCAGNDFWIEMQTGLIKYISWEDGLPNGIVVVAPNFKDFCLAIKTLE
jgi:hypothetical protein